MARTVVFADDELRDVRGAQTIKTPVILIGPERAGKTTIGKLLADDLGLPLVHLQAIARPYWEEKGMTQEAREAAWKAEGFSGLYHLMQPFEAYAIEKALIEHPDSILEVGASQSVFEDKQLLQQVLQTLGPYENIVLLLPSEDMEASLKILEQRIKKVMINGLELNEFFIKHHSNHDLAKQVIYTKDKTPAESCDDILKAIDQNAPEVILIGPMGAGKSTLGQLLAERLDKPQVPLDAIRWDYYKELGWDEPTQKEISAREGFAGVYRYWKKFEIHAVERALAEHKNCVMDFGAGHSVYDDEDQFARAQQVLAPYPNVVLLLPSPDLDESVRILEDRHKHKINGLEANQFYLTNPSNYKLAKLVVYTNGKSPEEVKEQILHRYNSTPE